MRFKYWVAGAAGALMLGSLSLTAQAAPLGGAQDALRADVGQNSQAQDVAWRRCWWHRGHRHCRWVGHRHGYYPYYHRRHYGYRPYYRDRYYGAGLAFPGFGFYFGPRYYW